MTQKEVIQKRLVALSIKRDILHDELLDACPTCLCTSCLHHAECTVQRCSICPKLINTCSAYTKGDLS